MANQKDYLATNRIEGLSDSIFGIAMTLLIFKIDIPDVGNILHVNTVLKDKLFELLPQFENYFASFLLLGFYWTGHQIQFKDIRIADRTLLWINIFFLAFVGLVPFTTGLMMKYSEKELPQLVYSINLMAIGLTLAIHWWYASKNHYLIEKNISEIYIKRASFLLFSIPVIFLICCILSFVSPRISLTLMYIVPFFFIITHKIIKRKT